MKKTFIITKNGKIFTTNPANRDNNKKKKQQQQRTYYTKTTQQKPKNNEEPALKNTSSCGW